MTRRRSSARCVPVAALGRRRAALLAWYGRHRRDLPWRRTRDPYAVWISEVMLQQTRVETVLAYYARFLTRWPTVEALAAARPEEVLALWSGLGYYRRAGALQAAAKAIVEGGGFPRSAGELERLPGIGPYTAAAVASIAFGEPVAVLDGNVERVAGRLLALAGDPQRAENRRRLAAAATALLAAGRSGDCNQALMEIGATLCRPRAPRCPECPLRPACAAAASGAPERFSRRRRRAALRRRPAQVALLERGGRVLLARRGEGERLLAGIWELPWAEGSCRAAPGRLGERYGGNWRLGPPVARLSHTVSSRRLEVTVRRASLAASGLAEGSAEARWVGPEDLARLPVSALVTKVLAAAAAAATPERANATAGRRRRRKAGGS